MKGRKRSSSVLAEEVILLSAFLPLEDVRDQLRGMKVSTRPTYPMVLQRRTSTAGDCGQALALWRQSHRSKAAASAVAAATQLALSQGKAVPLPSDVAHCAAHAQITQGFEREHST